MSVRTVQSNFDDLDPSSPSAYRVVMGFNDRVVHLDLSSANYDQAKADLRRYLDAGTPIAGLNLIEEDVRRLVSPTQIRRWAQMNGFAIGPTGRIPRRLQQLYIHTEMTSYPVLGES